MSWVSNGVGVVRLCVSLTWVRRVTVLWMFGDGPSCHAIEASYIADDASERVVGG